MVADGSELLVVPGYYFSPMPGIALYLFRSLITPLQTTCHKVLEVGELLPQKDDFSLLCCNNRIFLSK